MGEDLTQILQASAQKQFYEDCTLAEELRSQRWCNEKSSGFVSSSTFKHPQSLERPQRVIRLVRWPIVLFLFDDRLTSSRPATTRPSHITRYFGYQSFLSWSPYRQDLWGPARPQHVQVTADSREGGRERGEKFISTRSPKPVVQRPRDVLTSTHLRTTSTYRCVVSFVTFFSSLSLSLFFARYATTRYTTKPALKRAR